MKRLLGLYREKQYSPGRHKTNDARLLELIADRLRDRKLDVDLSTIEQSPDAPAATAVVFSMCQGKSSLEILAHWERQGINVINSPQAAVNTYRDRLPKLMLNAGLAFPETQLVGTTGDSLPPFTMDGGLWLKRGDVHASVPSDVQWIDSRSRLDAGFAEFASRGIRTAAVQTHQPGDEIKFYGVAGNKFFHWFYPTESSGFAFDVHALARLATKAAAAAGLDIFGGDIIVAPSGELTLIDLNDWPSFAPCLGPASEAIANFIAERAYDP